MASHGNQTETGSNPTSNTELSIGNLLDNTIPTKEVIISPDEELDSSSTPVWGRIRLAMRDSFSEFFGVFILVLFGCGSIAQVTLGDEKAGDYQSISWGWGIGVLLGYYCSGHSGAHLNPAVTLALCIFRNFPWTKFPIYVIAQVLGAFCGAAVVYANYHEAISFYEGDSVSVLSLENQSGIFATYPQPYLSITGQFFSEFLASAILLFCLFALTDTRNQNPGSLMPLLLFFLIFGIGACFGWETGYAINLARDLGPRLLTALMGYGREVWVYWWVPCVAPFGGGVFGAAAYDIFIFTGESPIHTPWWGLRSLFPKRKSGTEASHV